MGNEKEMDIIEKAHQAAERLERANKEQAELIKRMEEVEKRNEGRLLLGGEAYAGEPKPRELSADEKLHIDTKRYFKGTIIEKALDRASP